MKETGGLRMTKFCPEQMEGMNCHLVRWKTSERSGFRVGICGNQELSFENVKCEISLRHPSGDNK